MIDKRVKSIAEAMQGIKDGSTVMFGGFGAVGHPAHLIDGLIEQGAKDLTLVGNNAGTGRVEPLVRLLATGRVRKIICSFPRSAGSVVFDEMHKAGKLELELVPQGTLAERIRAAGAGIPATVWPDRLRWPTWTSAAPLWAPSRPPRRMTDPPAAARGHRLLHRRMNTRPPPSPRPAILPSSTSSCFSSLSVVGQWGGNCGASCRPRPAVCPLALSPSAGDFCRRATSAILPRL